MHRNMRVFVGEERHKPRRRPAVTDRPRFAKAVGYWVGLLDASTVTGVSR